MYGIPLTIYLLAGWLQSFFPEADLLSHDAGHIWYTLFGLEGDPHLNPVHTLANILLLTGFVLLGSAWAVLYRAQKRHQLAKTGLYACVRHPQYIAFVMILVSFLLMWPTILTLIMFPILVFMYIQLARREERMAQAEFGNEYTVYFQNTPAIFPKKNIFSTEKFPTFLAVIGILILLIWLPFILSIVVFIPLTIVYMIRINRNIIRENQLLVGENKPIGSNNEGHFPDNFPISQDINTERKHQNDKFFN